MPNSAPHSPKFSRVFIIVLDSLGIGADARAAEFDSVGANTLLHVSQTKLLEIPNLKRLGIDSIAKLEGYNKAKNQAAYALALIELSNAKDTLAGHWEMMGVKTEVPFPSFTHTGFPPAMLRALEKAWNRKIVGNRSASGTEIIEELADEEIKHNKVIVYTSADSVLQICGHEEHMGLARLYELCELARAICDSKPEWKVGRVIARPYVGEKGQYVRTGHRKDYAVSPLHKTLLETLQEASVATIGVGKIGDIFNHIGLSTSYHGESDDEHMDITIESVTKAPNHSLIFTNLTDFDSKYGHRRNAEGYAENLNRFDIKLGKLLNALRDSDLLLITGDHGTDPTYAGSDHTREEVPLLIYSNAFSHKPRPLPKAVGFGTIGNLVATNFGVPPVTTGEVIDLAEL